jgi:hypothetical protein
MSVKVVQEQVKEKSDLLAVPAAEYVAKALTAKQCEMVDEMLSLQAAVDEVRPKLKRYEEIKKELAAIAADDSQYDPEKPALLKGDIAVVEFGPCSHPREIKDMHGLIGALKERVGGYEGLLPMIRVTLKDVDSYLTEAESKEYVETVLGSRSLKSVRARKE